MKKFRHAAVLLAALLLMAVCVAGCSEQTAYNAIPYYDSTEYDGDSARYNQELFRRNDGDLTVADPSVLYVDDAERDDYGYFYLYGTFPAVEAYTAVTYRSRDLTNWEFVGPVLSENVKTSGLFRTEVFAPKVIEDGGKYYMFISASPFPPEDLDPKNIGYLYLLVSDDPYGPFDFVDMSGQDRAESYQNESDETVPCNDYWADKMYFDTAKYAARVMELEEIVQNDELYENYNYSGYFSNIDPYPFIDDDGTRYLYFVFRKTGDTNRRYLAGVECGETFADVKYDTMQLLTLGGYMDVQGTTPCSYQQNSYIDEGPVMIKHDGKYYLTYSYGSLTTSYQVGQAVSDSPLGVFRKLEQSENGTLFSGDSGQFDLANPGGHDIVEVDGKIYIVYHRNASPTNLSSAERCVAADELRWVSIKDKDGNDLDVLYANGPTVNLQPKFEFACEYGNIASEATIEVENLQEGSSAAALTDGLLSMYQYDSYEFNETYISETVITEKAVVTLTFPDYVSVRAIMIYNSKLLSRSFMEIERVEFDCRNADGSEVTNYISALQMDWRTDRHSSNGEALKNGSAAVAEFAEILCKEIRITIDVPQSGWLIDENGNISFAEEEYMMFEHEKIVGISEIAVLGK